jgi:hypothetical protein
MDLSYVTDAAGKVTWTLAFRRTPDDATPFATVSRGVVEANASTSEAVYADLMKTMLGNAPAAPPPLPAEDW